MIPILLVSLGLAVAAPPAPADIGDCNQLFIDDRSIADRDRAELRANSPVKLGLLRDEKGLPLRGHVARVIDDAGKAGSTSDTRTCRSSRAMMGCTSGEPG